jgi:hypothetical protein
VKKIIEESHDKISFWPRDFGRQRLLRVKKTHVMPRVMAKKEKEKNWTQAV